MNEIIREEIRDIAIADIDPKSSVNVRISKVAESVARLRPSIERNGFWRSSPITVRPHPDESTGFEYEIVAGQCRLKACLELSMETIPAVVQDLDNDAALQLSWAENEFSSELTTSDKAHSIHKIVLKYTKEGRTLTDARAIAAEFFNISPATVIAYHPLIGLPQEASDMLDDGRLLLGDAKVVAKYTHDPWQPSESEEKIMERVKWINRLNSDEKKAAQKALKKCSREATIEQLENAKEKELDRQFLLEEVEIPTDLHKRLISWGEERGLGGANASVIIKHMIVETLKQNE